MKRKPVIISATAGVGKTELAKRYKNVIDLESSPFFWDYSGTTVTNMETMKGRPDRKPNPAYPENYIRAIRAAMTEYDYVLVWTHTENAFPHYKKANLDFEVFAPTKDAVPEYIARFIARGNSAEWAEKVYARYDEFYPIFMNLGNKVTFLGPHETLESFLLKNSDKYPPLVLHNKRPR